ARRRGHHTRGRHGEARHSAKQASPLFIIARACAGVGSGWGTRALRAALRVGRFRPAATRLSYVVTTREVEGASRRLSLAELEQHLWAAANILRGPVDQADFKSYIFPLLFFKRICDVYDEEFADALAESDGDIDYASFAENHRFQI